MPTKSNNTGGRGGKRIGAGRKKKSLVEKLATDADNIEFCQPSKEMEQN